MLKVAKKISERAPYREKKKKAGEQPGKRKNESARDFFGRL